MTVTSPARNRSTAAAQKTGAARIIAPAAAVPALVAVTSVTFLQPAAADSYTVKKGDSLSQIAHTHGISLDNLRSINRITNPNLIVEGQTLQLPSRKGGSQAAAAKPAATVTARTKEWVDSKAGFGTWKVWDAQKRVHYIQGTGKQANTYISVFLATGSKEQARAAAKLGTAPAAAKAAPARASVPNKAYVNARAPFQTWKVWNAAGQSQTFQGTGAQANAYINTFLATGSKDQARAAAARLGSLSAPAPAQAPARVSVPNKAYVNANAPFQTWKVWNRAGQSHTFQGTGAQANAYINTFLATGSKDQARAAAARLGSLSAPAQAPAGAVRAPSAPAANYSTGSIQSLVAQIARQYGVDPALALAFAEQESSFQPNAVSSVGALGVMQVMPANQGWVSGLAGRPLNLSNTVDNITAGVVMIKHLLNTSSSRDNAIASYYQGAGAVQMYGWYQDTHRYVAGINARYARYAG
ncbi:LysM peptidoglycan-binding domain-containing protein [Arthrobacter sp. UM1]|uniref:lytic transglycosylase n=1 Tax=Arthrobacter sp. UM1 TaxID=2766776 RepID=UPI001CF66BDE|nr:LysM peptidoglycan-binding domain-containing protein [Arthrobacter sp. UM1]MCB4207716.1 LysM peptidoglycan-binding domain-containing protein [Arthrobacter sp. UM1]